MVKANLTGAGYGLNSWLKQRVTAVIMLIVLCLFIFFVAFTALNGNATIVSWQSICHYFAVKVLLQAFFLAMIVHAWVGVRDCVMDYVKGVSLRLSLYVLVLAWLLASLIYSIIVIWN